MFDASSGPKGPVSKINAYRGGCVIPCSAWGKLNTNTPTAVCIDLSTLNLVDFLCWTHNTEIWKSTEVCVLVFGFPPTEQGITHLPRYASIFQHMAKTVNLDNFPAINFEKSVKTSWFLLGLHLFSISGSNFWQFSGSFLNYTLWKHRKTCCFWMPHAIFSDNVDQQIVLNSMLVCSCPGFYRGKRPPGLYTPNGPHCGATQISHTRWVSLRNTEYSTSTHTHTHTHTLRICP